MMPDRSPARSLPSRISTVLRYTAALSRRNSAKHTVVFFFRSFYQFDVSSRWFAFLEDFAKRTGLGNPPLELIRKAFGAYFTMNRTPAEREQLLEDHYRIAASHMPKPFLQALWDAQSSELGRIAGKKDEYIVWLRRADRCGTRHEGECTIGFECRNSGLVLCRLTFIFLKTGTDGEALSLAIGGLQGPVKTVPKSAVIQATRDLGGLRPKDALLLVAAGIARSRGAMEMSAISNINHPINYRAQRRRSKMLTDYDDYWAERGGHEGGPFGFILPAKNPAEAEPAQKRRDEAKKAFYDGGVTLMGGSR